MANLRSSYVPYGGYELKAEYQRNMLAAVVLVAVLTVAFVVVGQTLLVSIGEIAEATSIDDGNNHGRTTIGPPPTVIRDESSLPGAGSKPKIDLNGTMPVPVSDGLVDGPELALPSQEELAGSHLPDIPGGSTGEGYGSLEFGMGGDGDEYLPAPEEYIYVDTEPELIHAPTPEYPRLAKEAGITGRVAIKALVSREGNVLDVLVAKSSGSDLLDDAAKQAAYRNKFKPALRGGQPVALWVTYSVIFTLDD